MKSELQARFLSVERVLEYAEELEEEEPESKIVIKPSSEWPMIPSIKFENCSLRYQADLPFVIESVSFDVQPAEKIGIVGRTGAGILSINYTYPLVYIFWFNNVFFLYHRQNVNYSCNLQIIPR